MNELFTVTVAKFQMQMQAVFLLSLKRNTVREDT